MRTLISFTAVGILGLAHCGILMAQESKKPEQPEAVAPKVSKDQPISFWMAKKLDYSKSILESLTKGDFEKLEQDAAQMRTLGKMEALVRRNNPNYRSQLQAFDLANNELVRQAKRKNAEGATMAFNQMTTSCVACHVLLRENKD
jgi:hypothetical protein